jgi:hypothetical protein
MSLNLDKARAESRNIVSKKFRFTLVMGAHEYYLDREAVEVLLDDCEMALASDVTKKRKRRVLGTQGQRTARELGRGVKALLEPKPKKRRE